MTFDERQQVKDAITALGAATQRIAGGKIIWSIPADKGGTYLDYETLIGLLDSKINPGASVTTNFYDSATFGLMSKAADWSVHESAQFNENPQLKQALSNPELNVWEQAKLTSPEAGMVGNIAGSLLLFEAGATGLKALSAATGIKALANPAVINSVTMSANTAINGMVNGDSWDTVVVNTVTSAISTATGTKVGNLVGNKVVTALSNLGLSEKAAYALAASSNGVSFAVTQSALEETKNAFMYGAEYKPDAASIAANIITSILFGSLETFKNNPKAAKLQNRLKQGDVSAQKEAADFLNKESQADNPLLTVQEQYINQWPKPQGVENNNAEGYNGNWDSIYKEAVKGAGRLNPKDIKPPGWNEQWEWRYPETIKPNAKPRWFDPKGGEWRWHAPDKWHPTGHWDYNPWDDWKSGWQNIYPD